MTDVIIIGAGAAGLAAGQRLLQKGKRAIILEARDRVGGRIHTQRDERGVIELGAEYIHGENVSTWEYVRASKTPTQLYFSELSINERGARIYMLDGKLVNAKTDFADRVNDWYDRADTYKGKEISVAEWFEQNANHDVAAEMARDRLARVEAADAAQLSLKALASDHRANPSGTENYRLGNGYEPVIRAMAKGLDIRLNCAVSKVTWDAEGVTVTVQGDVRKQKLKAKHLIITVPLSLLQLGVPEFEPLLPASKLRAIHALRMGVVCKTAFFFKQKFWRDFIFLSTNGMFTTWWPLASTTVPTLMNFTAGPAAIQLSALSEADVIAHGLDELSAAFGSEVRAQFTGCKMTDWSRDVWARGAYSYTPVGAGKAREVLAQPIGCLHFAGEATGTHGCYATVHGAIDSGYRAAEECV